MGFFKYIVQEWNDLEHKEVTAKGLLYAGDYAEAAQKLEKYYNLVSIIGLYPLEEAEVYDFDINECDTYLFKVKVEDSVI